MESNDDGPYTPITLAERIATHDDVPVDDHIVLLRDAAWSDYQRILELRGDRSVPRIAYLNGLLELMSPSEHMNR